MNPDNEQPVNKSEDFNQSGISNINSQSDMPEMPVHSRNNPKKSNKKLLIIITIVLVIAIAALAVWYFVFNKTTSTVSNTSTNNTQNNTVVESDPQLAKLINPTTGEVWLDTAIAMVDQSYFTDNSNLDLSPRAYYEVGSRAGNKIILVSEPGPMGPSNYLFEQSPDGTVVAITEPDALAVYNQDNNYPVNQLRSDITIDKTIKYDSLSIPSSIGIDDKGSAVMAPTYPSIGVGTPLSDTVNTNNTITTLVRQLGKSKIVKNETTNVETQLTSISYYLVTPMSTSISMIYEPLDLDLNKYQWSSGYTDYNATLRPISQGCGSVSASVTRDNSVTDNDFQTIGKSGNSLTVYEFKDNNNPLVQKAYTEYTNYQQAINSSQPAIINPLTIEDFMKQHAIVAYKDVNNQWLIYANRTLAPEFGCAKPVVYLYPTTAQTVKVKVGADVKVSDPLYNPATGWTALAQPNGQLTVNGVQYGSLFWEGPGYGKYPEITAGTIVKKEDVITIIRQQLAQQGLNATEANEFVAYWQDQVPDKPYIRLTWFNTNQMNQLAPLFISPKPDTAIRVFLDMSGMDNPINIPAQNLTSIPRNGFTVVEWGGLSNKKLY